MKNALNVLNFLRTMNENNPNFGKLISQEMQLDNLTENCLVNHNGKMTLFGLINTVLITAGVSPITGLFLKENTISDFMLIDRPPFYPLDEVKCMLDTPEYDKNGKLSLMAIASRGTVYTVESCEILPHVGWAIQISGEYHRAADFELISRSSNTKVLTDQEILDKLLKSINENENGPVEFDMYEDRSEDDE